MSGTNNSEKIIILTCTDVNISRRYKSERSIKVTCKDTNYERVFYGNILSLAMKCGSNFNQQVQISILPREAIKSMSPKRKYL